MADKEVATEVSVFRVEAASGATVVLVNVDKDIDMGEKLLAQALTTLKGDENE